MLHIPDNMRAIGNLLSCFVTERKHRSIKAAALHSFRHVEHTIAIDIVNRFVSARTSTQLYAPQFPVNGRVHETAAGPVCIPLRATLRYGDVFVQDIVSIQRGGSIEIGRVNRFKCFCGNSEELFADVSRRAHARSTLLRPPQLWSTNRI